jgi:hypothetical protein
MEASVLLAICLKVGENKDFHKSWLPIKVQSTLIGNQLILNFHLSPA